MDLIFLICGNIPFFLINFCLFGLCLAQAGSPQYCGEHIWDSGLCPPPVRGSCCGRRAGSRSGEEPVQWTSCCLAGSRQRAGHSSPASCRGRQSRPSPGPWCSIGFGPMIPWSCCWPHGLPASSSSPEWGLLLVSGLKFFLLPRRCFSSSFFWGAASGHSAWLNQGLVPRHRHSGPRP